MDGFQERKWFVYQTDHHEGPFSLFEIQQKMTSGEVQRTQYVWCEGMGDWQIMTAVREFEGLTAPAPAYDSAPAKDSIDFELNPPPQATSVALEIPEELAPTPSAEPPISLELAASEPEAAPAMPESALQIETRVELSPVEEVERVEDSSPEPEIPTLASTWKENPRSFGFLRVFLTLSLVGLGAYGYNTGHLDPVVKNPGFIRFASAVRGAIQPGLSKLAQWVPILQGVFSPIADIEGVLPEELAEMRKAAQSKGDPQASVALLREDLLAPTFYVGTNLPGGVSLDLKIIGIPDSLLSQTSLTATAQGNVDQSLARFDSIRQADGRPVVQGQYTVVVTESDPSKQSPEAAAALAALPDSKLLAPADSGITGPRKLVVTQSYFLGGPKDDTYAQRLKEFHERLATKSTDELREIRQLLLTLESQLKDTIREAAKQRANRNQKMASRNWATFHERWRRMQTQLEEAFSKWNDALMNGEYFHAVLYQSTRSAGDSVSQLHVAQNTGATQAELAPRQAAAEEQLARLRSQLEETEKLKPTDNGMPLRIAPELTGGGP